MTNDKPRIITLDIATSGCWWYRTYLPLDELKQQGFPVRQMQGRGEPLNTGEHDILLTARGYDGNVMDVIQGFKLGGKKIVFDTDDAMDLVEEYNPVYLLTVRAMPSYFTLMQVADVVTVSTERLKSHISKFTKKPIVVLPNCINEDIWQKTTHVKKTPNKRLKIGFAGSNSHIKDILPLIEAVSELQKKYTFDFVLWGFGAGHSMADWINRNRQILANVPTHPLYQHAEQFYKYAQRIIHFDFQPMVPIELYYHRLMEMNFDIGVCPLEPTEFNNYKSCIKYYEYARAGVLTLASDAIPYSDELDKQYLCDHSVKGWMDLLTIWIEKYQNQPEEFKKAVEEQQVFPREKRNSKEWADVRAKVYRDVYRGTKIN